VKIEDDPNIQCHMRPNYDIQISKLKWMPFSEFLDSIDVHKNILELARKKQHKIAHFVYIFEVTSQCKDSSKVVQKWIIRRRFKDFVKFSKALNHDLLDKKKIKIQEVPQLLNFYNDVPSLHKKDKENPEHFMEAAEKYLQALINSTSVRAHSAVLYEFIELSLLPLTSSSQRYKEGYMMKRGGGRFKDNKLSFFRKLFYKPWHKRWFTLTEEGLIYTIDASNPIAREVVLFDHSFKMEHGENPEDGIKKGVSIITPNRRLNLKARKIFKALDWGDALRKAVKASPYTNVNQYESFAPVRELTNYCKWYVDAQGYFEELYNCLMKAKKEVFITDWWLSPEIYLKTPVQEGNLEYRLDKVLGKVANSGVKVYAIVYHEIKVTLANDSKHTKKVLESQSPNIRVLLHPLKKLFNWSNHGKLVVIDQCVGFIGGLDLCFGRLDSNDHPIKDPEYEQGTGERFVGMEYSDPRLVDFRNVAKHYKSLINKETTPRMPWHDVMMKVVGPAVMDMSRHFIQFWNHVVVDTYKKKYQIPIIKRNFVDYFVSNNGEVEIEEGDGYEAVSRPKEEGEGVNKPEEQIIVAKSEVTSVKSPLQNYPSFPSHNWRKELFPDLEREAIERDKIIRAYYTSGDPSSHGSCTCQMVRSESNWSLGLNTKEDKTEHSIENAYIEIIKQAKSFIYVENQFFISSTAGKPIKNQIAQAMVDRIIQAHEKGERFRIIVFIPLLHSFEGAIATKTAINIRIELHWQYKTICRGGNSIYEQLQRKGIKPEDYIQFYSLRQHDRMISGQPATELIYIHSKLLVADDDKLIIGSANINDRSMLGTGDSEIAMVVEDAKKVGSYMNGKEVRVSEFVSSFRRRLLSEHLGLPEQEVIDPLSIEFTNKMNCITEENTRIYREIFACYPDDHIKKLKDVDVFSRQLDMSKYDSLSKKITGHIVWFPLKFLEDENLYAPITSLQYFASDKIFI